MSDDKKTKLREIIKQLADLPAEKREEPLLKTRDNKSGRSHAYTKKSMPNLLPEY